MQHNVDSSVWHHDGYSSQEPPKRDWTGTIALVLVVLLIIAAIVVFVIYERRGLNTLTGAWEWIFVEGVTTGTTDTFQGGAGMMYIGNNTGPLTLTITPPTTPIGKQFAVMNQTGHPITIAGTSAIVSNGTLVLVWTTATGYEIVSST